MSDDTEDTVQVVMSTHMLSSFKTWLDQNGMDLKRMKFLETEDDLPLYMVFPK